MYGLNVFALIVLIGLFYVVSLLSKKEETTQKKVLLIVSLVLLLFNSIKFIIEPSEIPVEFSTITYFVAPLILISRIRFLEIWAVYSAIMAGVFYYLTVLTTGGNTYELYSHANIYTSLYCHGSLFFLGLLKLKTTKYNVKQSFVILIGNCSVLIWALYIRPQIVFSERIFIYELIDGSFVNQVVSHNLFIFKSIYYVVLVFVIYKSSKVLFTVNEFLYKKRVRYFNKNLNLNSN